jgi:hypothetical protein
MDEKKEKAVEHFGFNDTVDVPDSGFTLLPEGEGIFTIVKVDTGRREYGKFGECNIADIEFKVTHVESGEQAYVKVSFPLVKELGWKILQLATATGLRNHDDGPQINPKWWAEWRKTGAAAKHIDGKCVIGHRANKKDASKVYNDITKFLAPGEEAPKPKGQVTF